ncbi:MAG TPA: DUF72 domain-containing protein [Actinomycetota bacterium]|nr:DUF72 domain-containing protein [Actinomycetota bacterium]
MAILVGTASWTDKTLLESGAFYPKEANNAEARLRYYAEQFPIVEVDSTYYFPPTEKNAVLWVERTPVDFTFHIKAYSLLTQHPTRPNSLYKDLQGRVLTEHRDKNRLYITHLDPGAADEVWKRFADALMPLHSAGKLGVVHFQFPEWFIPGTESRNYIVECAERLPDFQIAVEFRNATWMNEKNVERTERFLQQHDIPISCVDMPQGFRSSMPPVAQVTSKKLAYVRFHGRNIDEWDKPHETATPRFAYLYSEAELAEWVPKIKHLAEQSKQVHVLMNNCYRDYAQRNAKELSALLREAGLEVGR